VTTYTDSLSVHSSFPRATVRRLRKHARQRSDLPCSVSPPPATHGLATSLHERAQADRHTHRVSVIEVRLLGSGPELENSIGRIVVTHLRVTCRKPGFDRRRQTDRRFADSSFVVPSTSSAGSIWSDPVCRQTRLASREIHHGADTTLDAVVIGGGLAGAVCATTLAKQGRSVMVLERRAFPRLHIGESMLPYMAGLLERLGLLDVVRFGLRKTIDRLRMDEHITRVPRITQRLTGTQPSTQLRIEIDYCYHTDQVTGPGWLMVGDAGCFGDPMFSGGVLVTMVTGARAATTLAQALAEPAAENQTGEGHKSETFPVERIPLRQNAQLYTGHDERNSTRHDVVFRSAATPTVRCGSYAS
jgi:Tryptophan halogenase